MLAVDKIKKHFLVGNPLKLVHCKDPTKVSKTPLFFVHIIIEILIVELIYTLQNNFKREIMCIFTLLHHGGKSRKS